MAAINAPGSSQTVFTYAAALLNTNLSFSQVAMATTALMFSATATTATLGNISTNFLPEQVSLANANGFNPTVYAAEATGLALAGDPAFAAFTALNVTAFSQQVATLTGVNQAAIQGFADFWIGFYTQFPAGTQGLTVTQAAYGAAFGEAIGVALLNPTAANLQTVISTDPAFAFSPNTVTGVVANALILNGENLYTAGVALGSLPQHQLLQGEAATKQTTFTFTPDMNTFVGTNGDDIYNGIISNVGNLPATLSPLQFDSAKDMGGGNDRINLIVEGPTTLASIANLVTGVENWSFNTGNGPLNADLDASTLDSAKFIEQVGGASKTNWVDVINVGTGQTIAFTNQDLAAGADITVNTGVAGATAQLTNVDSGSLVQFNESTAGDLTTLTVNGSVAAVGDLNIDDNATAVTTLNLGITSASFVAIGTPGTTPSLQTIDASKSTGDLTIIIATPSFLNVKAVTMGKGNDTLTDDLSAKGPTVTTVTYNFGDGNDTFNVSLDPPAVGPHNVAMNVTLGSGADLSRGRG